MKVKHYDLPRRSGRYPWGSDSSELYKEGYSKDQEHDISPETHPAEPEYVSSLSLDELKKKAEELNTQFDDIGEFITDEFWCIPEMGDWLGNVFELIEQIGALNEVK